MTTDTNWLGVFSGYYSSGLYYQGNSGHWWSSTADSGTAVSYLNLGSGNTRVYPADSGNKYVGRAVRCILNPSDPDLTQISTMQEMTEQICAVSAAGAMKSLRDERDGTYYRVKKMVDGRCWMVDNLALNLEDDYAGKPAWGTAPVTVAGTDASLNNVPQQAKNNNTANQGQIPNNGTAKASYLYNWCAALADTSVNCFASVAATQYNTAINGETVTIGTATSQPAVTGICPASFRLPKGGPEATSGSKDTTANEFGKLDIAMGGTGANRSSANTYSVWTGTAATNTNWLGVLSGYYGSGLNYQGSYGYWWSSTASDATYAYNLSLGSSDTYVYPAYNRSKGIGRALRCIL